MFNFIKYSWLPFFIFLGVLVTNTPKIADQYLSNRTPASSSQNNCSEVLKTLMSIDTKFDENRFTSLYERLGKGYILEALRAKEINFSNRAELIAATKKDSLSLAQKNEIWRKVIFKTSEQYSDLESEIINSINHPLAKLLKNSSSIEDIDNLKNIISEIKRANPNMSADEVSSEILKRLKTCRV